MTWSENSPILLPGGRGLIVDGKFNWKAEDCCGCFGTGAWTDGYAGGGRCYDEDGQTLRGVVTLPAWPGTPGHGWSMHGRMAHDPGGYGYRSYHDGAGDWGGGLIKAAPDGTTIWTRTVPAPFAPDACRYADDGHVYLLVNPVDVIGRPFIRKYTTGGSLVSTIEIDPYTESLHYSIGDFAVRDGDIWWGGSIGYYFSTYYQILKQGAWQRALKSTPSNNEACSRVAKLVTDPDGNVYCAGHPKTAAAGADVRQIWKLNSAGVQQWDVGPFGSDPVNDAQDIELVEDGRVLVGGTELNPSPGSSWTPHVFKFLNTSTGAAAGSLTGQATYHNSAIGHCCAQDRFGFLWLAASYMWNTLPMRKTTVGGGIINWIVMIAPWFPHLDVALPGT